jgi:hypothetical protein
MPPFYGCSIVFCWFWIVNVFAKEEIPDKKYVFLINSLIIFFTYSRSIPFMTLIGHCKWHVSSKND